MSDCPSPPWRELTTSVPNLRTGWQRGEQPKIEDVVGAVSEQRERAALLGELLVLDWDYRRRSGEAPQIEEYRGRFPADAGVIERALSDVEAPTELAHPFVPPSIEKVADTFPNLEILELIGAGGMGAVVSRPAERTRSRCRAQDPA